MNNPRKADMAFSKVGNPSSDKMVNISDNSSLKIRVSANQQGSSSNGKMLRDRQARFLVQNHANFRKSGEPDRVMYYDPTGSWVDYPPEVLDLLKCSFLEGKAMAEVSMQGRNCLVDFYRMLEVEFDTGSEKSIAWIDVGGKCFFPQVFVNSSAEFSDSDENGGLEGVVGEDPNRIAIQVKVVDDLSNQENLNKRKRETGDIEVDQVVKGGKSEGSSSNVKNTVARASRHQLGVNGREMVPPPGPQRYQLGMNGNKMALLPGAQSHQLGVNGNEMALLPGARRLQLGVTGRHQLGVSGSETALPRWPDMRVLREEDKEYLAVSNLFLSGLVRVEPAVTITRIHQCARMGSVERERHAAFTELMETVQKARGDSNTVFAWYGTSARGVERILAYGFRMPDEQHRSRPYGVGVHLSPINSLQNRYLFGINRFLLGQLQRKRIFIS